MQLPVCLQEEAESRGKLRKGPDLNFLGTEHLATQR